MLAIGITVLILFIIAFGLWYFERILAKKAQRGYGLIMPIMFFILSVVSIVQTIPNVISQTLEAGLSMSAAILSIVISFVLINLPTLLVYVVYFRIRRKMGERPWPLRKKPDGTDASEGSDIAPTDGKSS